MSVSDKDFENVMAGLAEAGDFVRGTADTTKYRVHVPKTVDVKMIRSRLGLSQPVFASHFGFSAGAVRDWEQGRKRPEACARVLLTVIDKDPDAVMKALHVA
jgi:putative transcriptional regulator